MKLKRVSIDGKAYPVFYGMLGFAKLMQKHNLAFSEVQDRIVRLANIEKLNGDDVEFLYDFIHTGFLMGAEIEEIEFPFNVAKLSVYISLQDETVSEIFQIFSDSMPKPEEDQKKAKKKATAR